MKHSILSCSLSIVLFTSSALFSQYSIAAPLDSVVSVSESEQKEYAAKVKAEAQHAWKGYMKYAEGQDDLRPLSASYHNWYAESLLMTPVDAFDTLKLMGLNDEANQAHQLIVNELSFDKDIDVQVFEVTIRLLGGLISAYQSTGDQKLLKLAEDLGTRLLPAFNSATGMPYTHVNLKTGATKGNISNPAETGTLLLEFGALSKLTNNPVFYEKAKKALVETYNRRSKIDLVGLNIDVETGKWTNTTSHIAGGIDSYYEYLYKCWKLFGDQECKDMWDTSITAANKYLIDEERDGELWYGHSDMNKGKRTKKQYGALDAFMPGLLSFSGDIERAKRLQESNLKMWRLHGIEPESIDYGTMKVVSPNYALRPEIIESAYYLSHYTKDPRYIGMGKEFVDGLIKHTRTDYGHAALKDVRTKEKEDSMESFWMAETLKYAYLLFNPEALDFDNVVLNTEAHPIKNTWDKK